MDAPEYLPVRGLRGTVHYGVRSSADPPYKPDDDVPVFRTITRALAYLIAAHKPNMALEDGSVLPLQWTVTGYSVSDVKQIQIVSNTGGVSVRLIPFRFLRPVWASDVNMQELDKTKWKGSMSKEQLERIFSVPNGLNSSSSSNSDTTVPPPTLRERTFVNNSLKGTLFTSIPRRRRHTPSNPAYARVQPRRRRGSLASRLPAKPSQKAQPTTHQTTDAMTSLGTLNGSSREPVHYLPFNLGLAKRRPVDYPLARRFVSAGLFKLPSFVTMLAKVMQRDMSDDVFVCDEHLKFTFFSYSGEYTKWPEYDRQKITDIARTAKTASQRYVAALVLLDFADGGDSGSMHANFLLIDKLSGTVELFEPHGIFFDGEWTIHYSQMEGYFKAKTPHEKAFRAALIGIHTAAKLVGDTESQNTLEQIIQLDIAFVSAYVWSILHDHLATPLGLRFVVPPMKKTCGWQDTLQGYVGLMPGGRDLPASGGPGQCVLLSLFYMLARISYPAYTRDQIFEHVKAWMQAAPENALQFAQAFVATLLVSLPEDEYDHVQRVVNAALQTGNL